MKKIVLIILILILFSSAIFLVLKSSRKSIWINNQEIRIEIAQTLSEKALGLSNRESLCANCGMLFILGESKKHRFWMKEMQFNLDFVWIRGDKIVEINKDISYLKGEEEIIIPEIQADKVLEINAGKSSEWEIRVGDSISFNR